MTTSPATVRLGSVLLPLVALLATACGSTPTVEHAERFYLDAPASRTFDVERTLSEDSWIRGSLTIDVKTVEHTRGDPGAYGIGGTTTLSLRGRINGRTAVAAAPQEAVKAAMEPDNVPEVFESVPNEGGVSMTRVHWDRLGALRLPIEFAQDNGPAEFSSSLRGDVLSDAAEVALLWHKVLAPRLGIAPFGTFTASDVVERADSLELTLTHAQGAGGSHRFRYRFERGRALTSVDATLPDGSRLRLTASD